VRGVLANPGKVGKELDGSVLERSLSTCRREKVSWEAMKYPSMLQRIPSMERRPLRIGSGAIMGFADAVSGIASLFTTSCKGCLPWTSRSKWSCWCVKAISTSPIVCGIARGRLHVIPERAG